MMGYKEGEGSGVARVGRRGRPAPGGKMSPVKWVETSSMIYNMSKIHYNVIIFLYVSKNENYF